MICITELSSDHVLKLIMPTEFLITPIICCKIKVSSYEVYIKGAALSNQFKIILTLSIKIIANIINLQVYR